MATQTNRNILQPETGEYIQRLIPEHRGDPYQWAGSIEFDFRQHTSSRGFKYPVPGIKRVQTDVYKIETNSELPFVAGDVIRFGRDDKRRWTIDNIEYSTSGDKNYRRAYLYPDDDVTVGFKIFTLK